MLLAMICMGAYLYFRGHMWFEISNTWRLGRAWLCIRVCQGQCSCWCWSCGRRSRCTKQSAWSSCRKHVFKHDLWVHRCREYLLRWLTQGTVKHIYIALHMRMKLLEGQTCLMTYISHLVSNILHFANCMNECNMWTYHAWMLAHQLLRWKCCHTSSKED